MTRDYARAVAAFGEALRTARLEAGLSQEALAERAGLDRTYVSGTERGRKNPTLKTIARLSDAIGISIADLMAQSEAKENGG